MQSSEAPEGLSFGHGVCSEKCISREADTALNDRELPFIMSMVSEDDHSGGSEYHGWDVLSPQPLAMPSTASEFNC